MAVEHLLEKLQEYALGDIYPYHMPGHKRQAWGMLPEELYKIDITEIEGFDNLHQPEEILLELQKEAARLYGAEESFYLVNGSTCGILSAVSAALPRGGHILLVRNCHKSAYYAAYLRQLKITYLYPPYLEKYDIFDGVEPEQIREILEQEPGIEAVLVVTPTYEGRISDIRSIADIVHEKGIPLIVDEAHGAHLGLAEGFPENSCQLGADLVIHSVHKTLPALTQAALLHVNGTLIDRERLRRFLHIYQSSSPSYPLMASIDNALCYVSEEGKAAFQRFKNRFEGMMEKLAGCTCLEFLFPEKGRQDIGKLLISVKKTGITGKQLYDILLDRYRLQMEMMSANFVLAMFTVNDSEEAYCRMEKALLEIDSILADERHGNILERLSGAWQEPGKDPVRESLNTAVRQLEEYNGRDRDEEKGKTGNTSIYGTGLPIIGFPLFEAWDMTSELVSLKESIGRYIGEFINLYPPGIPLLVPGEQMTQTLCERISEAVKEGLQVQGIYSEERVAGTFFIRVLC